MTAEVRRQIVHIVFGALVVLLHVLGVISTFHYFLFFLLCVLVFLFNLVVPVFTPVFAYFEERGVRYPALGALAYVFGIQLALLFSEPVSYAAILVLCLGDGVATLVGRRGTHTLLWNRKKTWEGGIAGFAAASVCIILFFPVITSLFVALLAFAAESMDAYVDDNILLPLIVGAALSLI